MVWVLLAGVPRSGALEATGKELRAAVTEAQASKKRLTEEVEAATEECAALKEELASLKVGLKGVLCVSCYDSFPGVIKSACCRKYNQVQCTTAQREGVDLSVDRFNYPRWAEGVMRESIASVVGVVQRKLVDQEALREELEAVTLREVEAVEAMANMEATLQELKMVGGRQREELDRCVAYPQILLSVYHPRITDLMR
jgi:hypothetical protein